MLKKNSTLVDDDWLGDQQLSALGRHVGRKIVFDGLDYGCNILAYWFSKMMGRDMGSLDSKTIHDGISSFGDD